LPGRGPRSAAAASLAQAALPLLLVLAVAAWLYIHAVWPHIHHPDFDHNAWEAWALLHGHVATPAPPSQGDMVHYHGRWYSFFPPLPAFALIPFVKWYGGPMRTPVPLFSGILGVLAVGCAYQVCARAGLRLHVRLFLTAFFGCGTVLWYAAANGSPWYFVQTCTVFFYMLCLRESFGANRPALVGALFGCALLCRNPVALGLPFLFWREEHWDFGRIRGFLWPVALAVLAQLAWNAARFGNPLDTGYSHILMADYLRPSFDQGMFSYKHIPWQLYSILFLAPAFSPRWPYFRLDGNGQSLTLTSPAFIYALEGDIRERRVWLGLLATAATAAPQLLYYANGWVQFGNRFSLDYTPLLFCLMVFGIGHRFRWQHALLILVSIFLSGYGVVYGLHAHLLPHL